MTDLSSKIRKSIEILDYEEMTTAELLQGFINLGMELNDGYRRAKEIIDFLSKKMDYQVKLQLKSCVYYILDTISNIDKQSKILLKKNDLNSEKKSAINDLCSQALQIKSWCKSISKKYSLKLD